MAVIRSQEVRKLTKEQAIAKVGEFERVILELFGEGKKEKTTPVKKGIARLKTYITELERKEKLAIPTLAKAREARKAEARKPKAS